MTADYIQNLEHPNENVPKSPSAGSEEKAKDRWVNAIRRSVLQTASVRAFTVPREVTVVARRHNSIIGPALSTVAKQNTIWRKSLQNRRRDADKASILIADPRRIQAAMLAIHIQK